MRIRHLLPALCLLASAAPLEAQGIIVPGCRRVACPGPLPTALPVESVTLETSIEGQVATTHVTQVFRNETAMTLEGTYFFPIPSEASITEFALWDGDRRLEGEVRSREEARRIYDAIVRSRRDPGLLEYAGENLFQASIFPIGPRSTKKLEITYTQVLKAEGTTVGYRYPLGTGRNAVPIERVAGRVEIRAPRGIRNVYSPSHEVDVRASEAQTACRPGAPCGGVRGGRASVSFETGRREERRDFQLFYSLSDDEVGMSLLTYREPGKDGYFMLLLSPASEAARREYAAKDVVYVLDTSGSMREEDRIGMAKRALLFGLRGLGPQDRFNIVSFAGETRLMETGLVRADGAGRARGEAFVNGLRATGGTNINEALTQALAQFPRDGDRPRLLVFLTDGLPTVGVTDPARIAANVRGARRDGMRIFTFGVGYDVNTRLLDRVAADNGGVSDYIEPREDLEARVSTFFDKVNHPVLTGLRLDMGGVDAELVYPREMPDLFKGGQVALVGRYRNAADLRGVTLRLSGDAGARRQSFTYADQRFPLRAEQNDFLPRLWATRRVGWLVEQIRLNGESRELREEIVELGTRYGIVTPYTSFLALEPNFREGNAAAQDLSGRGVAGGVARGNRSPPPPSPVSAPAAPEAVAVTGQAGVAQARASRAQQDAVSLSADAASEAVRRVDARTFYRRGEVWQDAELRPDSRLPVTEVEFGTDAYFDLLRRVPSLARPFALGEQVDVVHEGRVYRVRSARAR